MSQLMEPGIIAAIGGAIFMLGLGLLIQKTKENSSHSYLKTYFSPFVFLVIGAALFLVGLELHR